MLPAPTPSAGDYFRLRFERVRDTRTRVRIYTYTCVYVYINTHVSIYYIIIYTYDGGAHLRREKRGARYSTATMAVRPDE